jgi:hypothetical protein
VSEVQSKVVALVPVYEAGGMGPAGLPRADGSDWGDTNILGQTLRRLAACSALDGVVLITSSEQAAAASSADTVGPPLSVYHVASFESDPAHAWRLSARKWSPCAWRGGLGGATCYDELLCPAAMVAALDSVDATAGLIVGPDWPFVDPVLCDAIVQRHRDEPSLQLVFTQAPPGLAGCLLHRDLLVDLDRTGTMIGTAIDYQPRTPQGDPIAKPNCVSIDPAVRDAPMRAVFDAPRWSKLLQQVSQELGSASDKASAMDVVAAASGHWGQVYASPQQVTLELTTDRRATGPIVPQHHATLHRGPISEADAQQLFTTLAKAGPDIVLTLGGVGDPLCCVHWESIVRAANDAGLYGIHLETDLSVAGAGSRLAALPLDVVSIRLNAGSQETYQTLMGQDDYALVIAEARHLLAGRNGSRPWIVPRLIKHESNLHELAGFLDQWMLGTGHAVIDPPLDGAGVAPSPNVLRLTPPQRTPCRQLNHRMTIHADGRAALCDQDWLGQAIDAPALSDPLAAWGKSDVARADHRSGAWDGWDRCAACSQWHCP